MSGVVVKPLEWEAIVSPREDDQPDATGDIEANTMIGEYSVCLDEDDAVSDAPWCCWSPVECIGHFADFDDAKAAAQADYEARIRSALAEAPAGVGDDDRIDGLRKLAGYVENGSDTTVSIFQDDATKSWMVRVGKAWPSHGSSLREAIDAAIATEPSP